MNFFGFGATPEIEIVLHEEEKRKTAEIKTEEGKRERHLLYYNGETVSGQVNITLRRAGAKVEHQGIRVELIGQIEMYYDRGNQYSFLSLYKDLARPGELLHQQSFAFEFLNVEKPYESYTGANCKLRYFIRVSIMKRLTDIIKEREIIVHALSQYPDMNSSIKMEVGIEDCLHIEFEYNRSKYHLKDVIIGKIYFLLVRIKIKHMELAIIKRETTGSGPTTFNENETIAKFEIMDGAPVRGESIPIRVFLAGYDLTPTFKDVNRKFSVRYYLNLVLVDEEDRRYFKQQEIILWRKIEKPRKSFQATLQQQYRDMQNPNAQGSPNGNDEKASSSSRTARCSSSASNNSSIESNGQVESSPEEGQGPGKDDQDIANSVATMKITNKAPVNDATDSGGTSRQETVADSSRDEPVACSSKQALLSAQCWHKEKSSESPFTAAAAGTSKRLSADDSDDENVPTLTGSICQADVHNVSHELALDAAATVEVNLNDDDDDEVGNKCDKFEGKEE